MTNKTAIHRTIIKLSALATFAASLVGCKMLGSSEEVNLKCYHASRKLGIHKAMTRKATVGDEFKPYVAQFESHYGGPIGEVGIRFGEVSSFAVCRLSSLGTKTIIVDQPRWDNFARSKNGPEKLAILMFHELGHCVLNIMDHRDHRIVAPSDRQPLLSGKEATYPSSIMSSFLSNRDLDAIVRNQDAYISELFRGVAVDPPGEKLR